MQVKTQHDGLENYLTDASNMPGGHAEKLFVPESADEIAEILRESERVGNAGDDLWCADGNGRRCDTVWRLCHLARAAEQDQSDR